MTTIICLANSWKKQERCIAGINPKTGQWIRPICLEYPQDGRIPQEIRLINNQEPQLLDLLEIPLDNTGPDFGFESENYAILPGKWQKVGTVKPTDVIPYCDNYEDILHNSLRYVTVPFLQSLPFGERRTLQLVYTLELIITGEPRSTGIKWRGTLITKKGEQLTDASITDPIFVDQLDSGYRPKNPCLVTVSLSMPYRFEAWEKDDPCWKLIAGIIELSDADLILVEMKRLGWTIEQGRNYLQQKYHKYSRKHLTEVELEEFLNYLKFL